MQHSEGHLSANDGIKLYYQARFGEIWEMKQ
jgi:hypothetical protein